jgi:hypothetical protein
VAGRYQMPETNERPLTQAVRDAVADEIDYVILAQCNRRGPVFRAFRDNPALQATDTTYRVELAMAPLQRGSGLLSVRDLAFDLLDLRFLGETEGFLFASMRVGADNVVPYDTEPIAQSLCLQRDGTLIPDCAE